MSPEEIQAQRVIFAGLAMQALVAGYPRDSRLEAVGNDGPAIARNAIRIADAMIAELSKPAGVTAADGAGEGGETNG